MTSWRDERQGWENLAHELPEGNPLRGGPCTVSHEDAGGACGRGAEMMVYGLPFCEVHGAEVKAGALEELHHDTVEFLELFDREDIRGINPEVRRAIRSGLAKLPAAVQDAWLEAESVLLRAYPLIPERVDPLTSGADYDPGYDTPYDTFRHARHVAHRLMRLAFEEGEDDLVMVLEREREHIAAQASFALVDMHRRFGEPRERARAAGDK